MSAFTDRVYRQWVGRTGGASPGFHDNRPALPSKTSSARKAKGPRCAGVSPSVHQPNSGGSTNGMSPV